MEVRAASGWYADPWEEGELRWWDGQRWTGAITSDASSPPPSPLPGGPAPGVDQTALRLTTARALMFVGAFLAGSGSIAPWATLSARPFVDQTITVYGTDGADGVATLIGAIAIAGLGLFGFGAGRLRWAPAATLVVSAFIGLIAALDMTTFDTRVADFKSNGSSLNVTPEAGMYAVLLGGTTSLVGSALFLRARRARSRPQSSISGTKVPPS